MSPKSIEKEKYRARVFYLAKNESDRLMNFLLGGFYVFGIILAFFYNTWAIAIGIGGASLLAFYGAKKAFPGSDFYQYVLAGVLGIFVTQYIYQMHGLFEMNFVTLIASGILIIYQNWKLQLPLILVVVIHHSLFAYLNTLGFDKIYFSQFEHMTLQALIFRQAFCAVVFFNCGFWAYRFKKYTERNVDQCYEIVKLGEEQQQKEELLKMSEINRISNERLKEAQKIAHVGSWTWDIKTNTTFRTDEFYDIVEKDKSVCEPNFEGFLKCVHPDDMQLVMDKNAQAKTDHQPFSYEVRLVMPDKRIKYVFVMGKVNENSQGEAIELNGIIQDITERKLGEKLLKQSELQFRELFESAPEAIVIVDADTGKFMDVNSNMLKLFKYSPEEILQKTPANLSPEFQHDGRDSASKVKEVINRANAGEKPVFEWVHCDAAGNLFPCEVRLTKLSVPGRNLIRASIIDITEKKKALMALSKSEADLRSIFENTSVGYLLVDTSFKILSFNKEVQKFAQRSFHRPLKTGVEFLEYFAGEQREFRHEKMQKVLGGEYLSYESVFPQQEGLGLVYAISMFPVLDGQDAIMGVGMSVVDITEQKRAEKEIKTLNESLEEKVKYRTSELEAANKELESFSYSVSHDLRAPLRIINGFSKLLIRRYSDKFDDEGKENLEIIMNNAKRMGHLIDDLLDFSRVGRTELQKNRLDMNGLVKSVIKDVKSMDNNVAEVRVHDLKDANADPSLIKQVWVNLLTNATKYSRNKENPVIEIGTIGENGHLTYYVKDNGAGFDMEHYGKLFGVFQRLHKVTEYEGTGVGLALTQRIINRHGGKIWAESKVNEGATFYFTLPSKPVDNEKQL